MQSHLNSLLIVCVVSLVSVGFAREAATSPEKTVSGDETQESTLSFPYVAEITGDNVYIRSGPGTRYYYSCGKLNKTDRVKVVAGRHSWSHIVPPAGSFSWISKQYVNIDPNNPALGTVTGEAVRVYAGSEHIKPIHSTTVQLKLNRGDKVNLMGEEKGDYYKIAPPAGAYLWVSTQYTKPLGPVGEIKLTVEPQTKAAAVVLVTLSTEAEKLKEYYALEKQIQAEQAKPMAQQDYANIKKALLEIANNKEAGKAARYARFTIKQIKRFELALAVAEELQLQDAQLREVRERIEKARTTKLAQVPQLGGFTVIGQFKTSIIYGHEAQPKLYRITDDSGKTLCYALPSGSASVMDLSEFINRKVGLVGTVQPYPQTVGALLRFTEITEIQ